MKSVVMKYYRFRLRYIVVLNILMLFQSSALKSFWKKDIVQIKMEELSTIQRISFEYSIWEGAVGVMNKCYSENALLLLICWATMALSQLMGPPRWWKNTIRDGQKIWRPGIFVRITSIFTSQFRPLQKISNKSWIM